MSAQHKGEGKLDLGEKNKEVPQTEKINISRGASRETVKKKMIEKNKAGGERTVTGQMFEVEPTPVEVL